ncbi:hypothetical protein I4U23_016720 [Adineta vaga]|nr:hypothetical protein I4U23_016720 [Adineta vaga]
MKHPRHIMLEVESNYSEQNKHDNERQNSKTSCYDIVSKNCVCCSKPFLIGLTIAALLVGIAFATLLTLYLLRPGSTTTFTTTSSTSISTSTSTGTSTTTTITTTAAFDINLVINGDAETGSCQTTDGATSPTGWSFSGPITQIIYNNPTGGCLASTVPGPNDRGNCYFYGQLSGSTSMWQTIDLTNKIHSILIDNQTVQFNLSAWLGGYDNQNDNAEVSLTFIDSNNQIVGNCTSIGPILATNRSNISKLVFRQTNGFLPVGTRSIVVFVTINRSVGLRYRLSNFQNKKQNLVGHYIYNASWLQTFQAMAPELNVSQVDYRYPASYL